MTFMINNGYEHMRNKKTRKFFQNQGVKNDLINRI